MIEIRREYRIKSTGLGADHFGTCERCGKLCTCHYMQQIRKIGAKRNGWSTAGFGHVECLQNGKWKDAPVEEDPRA